MLLAMALCLLLIALVDWPATLATLQSGHYGLILAGLLLLIMTLLVLQALRLWAVAGGHLNWRNASQITGKALFYQQFMPSAVGGDAIRGVLLSRQPGYDWKSALGTVGAYRVSGLLTLAVLALAYLLLLGDRVALYCDGSSQLYLWLLGLIGLGFLVLTFIVFRAGWRHTLWGWLRPILAPSLELSLRNWLSLYAYALGFHLLRGIALVLFLQAFGGHAALIDVLFVLTLMAFSGLLPIAFGGVGVIESALVFGFMLYGVPEPMAVSVALCNRLGVIMAGLLGGAVGRHLSLGQHARSRV